MAPSSPLASAGGLPNAVSHVEHVARAPLSSQACSTSTRGHGSSTRDEGLHKNAVRRSASSKPPTSGLTNPKLPVTVNPGPSPEEPSTMPKKNQPSLSPSPPDPASFTFSSLLSSIGPEADDSITAIAEICGKSKMSLADEHGSHLPPLGKAVVYIQREGGTTIESRVNAGRAGEGGGVEAPGEQGLMSKILDWLRGGKSQRESTTATKSVRRIMEEQEDTATG